MIKDKCTFMEYNKNNNVTYYSNRKGDPRYASRKSNCIEDIIRSYTVLETMNDKNDVKLKISKLEAYSRQLCLNLKDLQKNREVITSKTMALSEELKCAENEDIVVSSETDIHVLLRAKKSGCCTICKGHEEWENDLSESEEMNELQEPLKANSAFDELDNNTSQCCCCVCYENRTVSHEYFCEKCNCCGSTFGTNSSTDMSRSFEKFRPAGKISQEDTKLCSICGNAVELQTAQCYEICGCERGNNNERCRGGMDCMEAQFIIDCAGGTGNKRARRMYESYESCPFRNFQRSLSGSSSCTTKCKLFEESNETDATDKVNIEKVSLRDKESSKLGEDRIVARLDEVSKGDGNSIEARRIINKNATLLDLDAEDCRVKMNDLDRSQLLRYLAAMDAISREGKNEKFNVEDKTSQRDVTMGLFVLFLIVFSHVFRYTVLSSISYYFRGIFMQLLQIFDSITNEFSDLARESVKLLKSFDQEFGRGFMNFGSYANVISRHLTIVGALFGSISFAKSFWSLAKIIFLWVQKYFHIFHYYSRFDKFYRSVKRSTMQIIFCAKSQYHFFSYLSCLAFGFLMGKVSRIIDKWSLISLSIPDNELGESEYL